MPIDSPKYKIGDRIVDVVFPPLYAEVLDIVDNGKIIDYNLIFRDGSAGLHPANSIDQRYVLESAIVQAQLAR